MISRTTAMGFIVIPAPSPRCIPSFTQEAASFAVISLSVIIADPLSSPQATIHYRLLLEQNSFKIKMNEKVRFFMPLVYGE
jgi:hypothetical protein